MRFEFRVKKIFGKVIDNWELVKKIESVGTRLGETTKTVIITDSGEIK